MGILLSTVLFRLWVIILEDSSKQTKEFCYELTDFLSKIFTKDEEKFIYMG